MTVGATWVMQPDLAIDPLEVPTGLLRDPKRIQQTQLLVVSVVGLTAINDGRMNVN